MKKTYKNFGEALDSLRVEHDFFYEFRLRKMLEFVDKNRKFLDFCEDEAKNWSKRPTPPDKKKEAEKVEV